MTEKRCTDCKYTKGVGFDFWCGEGHTEYEVFGAETNCPYYEYHDWSKCIPSKTEKKRFVDLVEECLEDQFLIDTSNDKYYWVSDSLDDIVKLLNELHKENKKLKQVNEMLQMDFAMTERNLIEENEQLKNFKSKLFTIIDKEWEKTGEYNHVDTAMYYARKQLLQDLKKELEE